MTPTGSYGERDRTTWRYRAWFRTYVWTRKARHFVGIHDKPLHYSIAPRCDWCGHRSRSRTQQAIAEANSRALDESTARAYTTSGEGCSMCGDHYDPSSDDHCPVCHAE